MSAGDKGRLAISIHMSWRVAFSIQKTAQVTSTDTPSTFPEPPTPTEILCSSLYPFLLSGSGAHHTLQTFGKTKEELLLKY